jgi:hypothetical protein
VKIASTPIIGLDIVIVAMRGDTIGRDRGLAVPVGPRPGDRGRMLTLVKATKILDTQSKAVLKIAGLKTVAKVGERAATIAVALGKNPRKVPTQIPIQSLALATMPQAKAIVIIPLQSMTPGIVLQDMLLQGMTILRPQTIVTTPTILAIGLLDPLPMIPRKPIALHQDDRGGGPPLIVHLKKGLPMWTTVPSSPISRTWKRITPITLMINLI